MEQIVWLVDVLRAGRHNTEYAESLLDVAIACVHARRSRRNSSLTLIPLVGQLIRR